MYIYPKNKKSSVKYEFKETLGYFPEKMAQKPYMQAYHNHHEYRVIDDTQMGFKLRIRITDKDVGRVFRDAGNFISKTIEKVAEIAKPAMVVVEGIGEVAENVYREASKVAENVWRETSKFATDAYREVGRPAFRIVRNVVNEVAWQPFAKAVDFAVVPLLPKSIRENFERILSVPDKAFRGKITGQDVINGVVSYYKLLMVPTKTVGRFANDTINTLRKDAILGPFLADVDKYTGGLLKSAQNLSVMADDIYHDRDIDWKARIIDGLKIYLATVSATALAKSTATTYVGERTGLNETPIGRAALSAAVAYAGTLKYGSNAEMAQSATTDALEDAAKNAAIAEAKSEAAIEAVKKGWVDDKQTAALIMSAGGKLYDTAGTDKTFMSAMKEFHDKEFQPFVDKKIKDKTGLPITYAHLADVYNTKWSEIADKVAESLKNIPVIGGTSIDSNFLQSMGQNFIDEIKRVPENFPKIADNVLNEIQKSPEKLKKFAQNVANEAERSPDNIAKIANRIAEEGKTAVTNIISEAERLPGNVADITENIIDEVAQGSDKVVEQLERTKWDELLKKHGPGLVNFIRSRYPGFDPSSGYIPDYIFSDIDLNFADFAPIPERRPLGAGPIVVAGLVGVAAIALLAQDD